VNAMHLIRSEFDFDKEEAVDFAAARGFGLLVVSGDSRPCGSHLPFVIRREAGRTIVSTHVTAANPLAALADGRRNFLLAVSGPDAYVSNDWYASSDQVSTWLYEAVHLTGPGRLLPPNSNRHHGDDLLAVSEQRLAPKSPWSLSTMEPTKREAMLGRIRVIEFDVEWIECQRKLNQFKPDVDHVAVVNALLRDGDENGRRIAAKMRALRPHLDYDQ